MAHDEPPHPELRCLQIQLLLSLVDKEFKPILYKKKQKLTLILNIYFLDSKVKLMHSLVISIFMYACESWTLTFVTICIYCFTDPIVSSLTIKYVETRKSVHRTWMPPPNAIQKKGLYVTVTGIP